MTENEIGKEISPKSKRFPWKSFWIVSFSVIIVVAFISATGGIRVDLHFTLFDNGSSSVSSNHWIEEVEKTETSVHLRCWFEAKNHLSKAHHAMVVLAFSPRPGPGLQAHVFEHVIINGNSTKKIYQDIILDARSVKDGYTFTWEMKQK